MLHIGYALDLLIGLIDERELALSSARQLHNPLVFDKSHNASVPADCDKQQPKTKSRRNIDVRPKKIAKRATVSRTPLTSGHGWWGAILRILKYPCGPPHTDAREGTFRGAGHG